MKIRKARKGDLEEIAEIYRVESAKKPYGTKYSRASALKDVSELIKEDLYVAVEKEKIIGFVSSHVIQSNKKHAYIDELWIRHNYQGKGAGKKLMEFVEDMYVKRGISKIRLVTKIKANAYGFYKKLKYGDSVDTVFMDKKL